MSLSKKFLSASKTGKISILKNLHDQDENIIESRDGHGDTALIIASRHSNKKVINLFIKNFGIDAFETGFKKRNCFHNAVIFEQINNMKHLQKLYPSLVFSKDEDENTPLTLSCLHSNTNITELLVNKLGADFKQTGNLKRTPFQCAVLSKNKSTLMFFKELYNKYKSQEDFDGKRADIKNSHFKKLFQSKDANKDTALTLACQYANKSIIELLIQEFNCKITETGENDKTCFIAAVQGGNIEIIEFVASLDGASCLKSDCDGKTAKNYTKSVAVAKLVKDIMDRERNKEKNKAKKDRRRVKKQKEQEEERLIQEAIAAEKIRHKEAEVKRAEERMKREEQMKKRAEEREKREKERLKECLEERLRREQKRRQKQKQSWGYGYDSDDYYDFDDDDDFGFNMHDLFEHLFRSRRGYFDFNSFARTEEDMEADADAAREHTFWEKVKKELKAGGKNYYQILNVDQSASRSEIKKSFGSLIKEHHPDRNGDNNAVDEDYAVKLIEAKKVIEDDVKREKYDSILREVEYLRRRRF